MEKPERKRPHEGLNMSGKIILKWILKVIRSGVMELINLA
jgi:hypothetical protein